ncbi:DUF3888 domain-containing protein [Psychrobacillus sp. PGGUH221]|uniref:DUF3888 domain-containing protein n=1 Tax=Psychrobacillus sp. PGGUH221 TaxID=3020058 RepID=UPI0035C6E04F
MKKILLVFSFVLFLLPPSILVQSNTAIDEPAQNYYQPEEKSKEELMMDLFLSLLSPNIDKAITNYYSDSLLISPMVYPYQIKILNMERTNGYRGFIFSVTIEVTPVVGPHIPVGKDQLTFTITPSRISLTEFKHIETYDLPPHWQYIIKKK